jgi:DNA-binding IclR family transcriptional regulator
MNSYIMLFSLHQTLAGENIVLVYIAEGPSIVRLAGNIGDWVLLHAATGAKAFLAYCSPRTPKKVTGHPITSIDNKEVDEGT